RPCRPVPGGCADARPRRAARSPTRRRRRGRARVRTRARTRDRPATPCATCRRRDVSARRRAPPARSAGAARPARAARRTRRRACAPPAARTRASGPRPENDTLAAVPLEGKRVFVTGGAGFIGTTLARDLVDRNTVVAFDNLHRDALSGTSLAVREAAHGATHIVHCAAIAGVDTVLESPVRTMRVNVIGTYNVLEAAIATQ